MRENRRDIFVETRKLVKNVTPIEKGEKKNKKRKRRKKFFAVKREGRYNPDRLEVREKKITDALSKVIVPFEFPWIGIDALAADAAGTVASAECVFIERIAGTHGRHIPARRRYSATAKRAQTEWQVRADWGEGAMTGGAAVYFHLVDEKIRKKIEEKNPFCAAEESSGGITGVTRLNAFKFTLTRLHSTTRFPPSPTHTHKPYQQAFFRAFGQDFCPV